MDTLFAFLLLLLSPNDVQVCMSTVFGHTGDKHAGGNTILLKRPVEPGDMGIAHRTLPMGSTVAVQNTKTGMIAIGKVIDRGPYGAILDGSWLIKRKPTDPGKWRGCVDLTPDMAKAIGHKGFDTVRVFGRKRK